MKKLLIALAALGSVNAFASTINVNLSTNTNCPVAINGVKQAAWGATNSFSSDQTYLITEYTSYSDNPTACDIAAGSVLLAVSGNKATVSKDASSSSLQITQGATFAGTNFTTAATVDGRTSPNMNFELENNQTSHNLNLVINGSGLVPAADKPEPTKPDFQYPDTLVYATITNNTSCTMEVSGRGSIAAGQTQSYNNLPATTSITEHMDLNGKCDLTGTTNIHYQKAMVSPHFEGGLRVSQLATNGGDAYFTMTAAAGIERTAKLTSQSHHTFDHVFASAAEANHSNLTIIVGEHAKSVEPKPTPPSPVPGTGVYPDGQGNYTNGSVVTGQDGKVYKCTVAAWCNQSTTDVYAPGTGRAWTSAWEQADTVSGAAHAFW